MKIIADENIPLLVVYKLRNQGNEIISITENYRGIKDIEIIQIAQNEKCYILTFDKDFGELIYKHKINIEGIILLRFAPYSIDYILEKINRILSILKLNPGNNFIVVDDKKVRIRKLKKW